jgi:hypothetical protein
MSPIAQSSLPNKLDVPLRLSALLVLFAGVGLGLFTLSSAAGIWLGAWDYRTGLGILRMANTAGPYLFWGCLALGIGSSLFAMLMAHDDRRRLITYAGLGIVTAALGYGIPESFRPPAGVNYPMIHDITTDTDYPPQFVDIVPLRGTNSNSIVYGGAENVTAEELAALTKEASPDLVPRVYDERHADVYRRALNAVETLGWEIVSADFDSRRIEATDTTLWFRFKDDIVITFGTQSNNVVVNARSTSRVGVGDVGANAARLRRFFALLDAQ